MKRQKTTFVSLVIAVSLASAETAPAEQPERRVQTPTSDQRQVSEAIRQQELATEPVVIDQAQLPRETLLQLYRISEEALAAGKLTAVNNDRAEVVNAANISEVLVPSTVLVQQVRSNARNSAAPASLMADKPSARTYALSWEVTTADGKFAAWGRDSTGLNFDGAERAYAGEFDVALTRLQNPSDSSILTNPVAVAIGAPGAASINPRPLRIAKLNDWHGVAITVPDIAEDTYEVSVSANPTDEGDRIPLPVSRPTITITPRTESIVGWGIGRTAIAVQAKGMRQPAGYQVSLASRRGTLSSGSVALDAQGKGEVWLRSSRHNGTKVSITDQAFMSETKDVRFEAPWLYLALAVAGGFAGAFLRGRGTQHWIKALSVGAVTGVLMALMYSVGINWLGRVFPDADLARGGEAIVFVLGAIGAYLGVSYVLPKDKPT